MQRCFSAMCIGLLTLLLAACGGKDASAPTAAPRAVTAFPTYEFVPPTSALIAATAATLPTVSNARDPEKVALGLGRYEALACGGCHGVDAKGTPKGKSLVPTALTEAQFVDFLRTGGKLGNDHLYSSNRLSDTGIKNLYLYIQSLTSGN